MTMADRIALLNEGKIVQTGTPSTLYHKPVNLFVAGFIGSPPMNFFTVSLKYGEKQGYVLDAGDFEIGLPIELADTIVKSTSSTDLVLGVRPEDIIVSKEPIENSFTAEVYVVEPLGSETIVNLKVGEYVFKSKVLGEFQALPGDRVYVRFKISKIHVFEKASRKAII